MTSLIGSRVERKEDKKFLTGKGRYTADINLAHQTYACFVRSPHARAKINKVDISKALRAPGVVKILTGDDLAKDSVNFVGDHVAVVIAETLEEAKNAAEQVDVGYKIQKAVQFWSLIVMVVK